MTARLLAALGLLVAALVLVPTGPAAACSCVTDQPDELAGNAQFAFVGLLRSQRADDDDVAHRFSVETVLTGAVHRTQDVVTPHQGEAGCGVEWEPDARMVVLGYEDEEGRLAANLCTGSAPSTDTTYDDMVSALGTGVPPTPGSDLVEIDRWRREDLRWVTLAVGLTGLAALGVIARRHWRSRG